MYTVLVSYTNITKLCIQYYNHSLDIIRISKNKMEYVVTYLNRISLSFLVALLI